MASRFRTHAPSRRALLRGGAITVASLAAPNVILAQQGDTLVVNAQGGEYQPIFESTVLRPFEQMKGVRVVHDATGTASQDYARIRASRGRPGFDVACVVTAAELALGGREGYFERVTPNEVPNAAHLWSRLETLPRFGVPHSVQYASLVHLKERIEAPRSWMDYWNPGARYGEQIRSRVNTFNPANLLSLFVLIAGAEARGGGTQNMAPAWENLATLKPYVGAVQTTVAQLLPMLERGQIWLTPFWSARAIHYIKQGMPFGMTIPREGTLALAECAAVLSSSNNKRLAFEFVNFWLSPDVQRAYCLAYNISPARRDLTGWPADFAELQVTTEEKMAGLRFPDMEAIGQNTRAWTLRWQEIMGV